MSFERRISSLPLYTRNLHIVLSSVYQFALEEINQSSSRL